MFSLVGRGLFSMALYTVTLADLTAAVTSALGGSPIAPGSALGIVRRAMDYLSNFAPWTWRTTTTPLNFTADTSYIELPADYGRLIGLAPSAYKLPLIPSTLAEVLRIRGNSAAAAGLHYAITAGPQATAATVVRRRLELAPTPAASLTAALTLAYFKLIPQLASSTDVPAIPAGLHGALIQCVRWMAHLDQEPAGEETAAEARAALQMLSAARDEDAAAGVPVMELCDIIVAHDRSCRSPVGVMNPPWT